MGFTMISRENVQGTQTDSDSRICETKEWVRVGKCSNDGGKHVTKQGKIQTKGGKQVANPPEMVSKGEDMVVGSCVSKGAVVGTEDNDVAKDFIPGVPMDEMKLINGYHGKEDLQVSRTSQVRFPPVYFT
ncbi:hypothetical protein U1Q18_022875 [Sarracenia purpurea var. burkii]